MTLPSSGLITLGAVNTELGNSSTATITLNDSVVRTLFGLSSGLITLNDGHGKSNAITVSYLVVAGGGGGGCECGPGAGAGGLLASTATLTPGTTYSITVGSGGAGGTSYGSNGVKGNDSVMSGSGFATLSAVGGGGISGTPYGYGGSAAGGGTSYVAGQGNPGGGSGPGGVAYLGPGGGGAGAAGHASTGSNPYTAGNGGIGVTTSLITTTQASTYSVGDVESGSVYFAGGGGAGGNTTYGSGGYTTYGGVGGWGGGGIGGNDGSIYNGGNGTTNTGGGGGGGLGYNGNVYPGGNGGSGCVIISAPKTAASTTGSPSSTTNGSNYVYIFTGTGSITF